MDPRIHWQDIVMRIELPSLGMKELAIDNQGFDNQQPNMQPI